MTSWPDRSRYAVRALPGGRAFGICRRGLWGFLYPCTAPSAASCRGIAGYWCNIASGTRERLVSGTVVRSGPIYRRPPAMATRDQPRLVVLLALLALAAARPAAAAARARYVADIVVRKNSCPSGYSKLSPDANKGVSELPRSAAGPGAARAGRAAGPRSATNASSLFLLTPRVGRTAARQPHRACDARFDRLAATTCTFASSTAARRRQRRRQCWTFARRAVPARPRRAHLASPSRTRSES